jgi:ABC-type sugar transport system ATPase subunit
LDEIFEVADRVQVLRDGRSIKVSKLADTSRDDIVRNMIGRELKDMYPLGKRDIGKTSFEVRELSDNYLRNISFSAREGEIVGLYGLMGSGCSESLKSIFGTRRKEKGEIYINGQKKEIKNPRDAVKVGIAYIPEERKAEGILAGLSVMSNISVVTLGKYRMGPILSPAKEKKIASHWMKDLNIKTPSLSTQIETLSGGNQQKVIIAKWLDNNPKVFLMNEPTRGLDVGAKVEIYKQMEILCHKGCTVVLVATDLPELLALSDRVYVFHNGMITDELGKDQMTQENIIKSAIGEQR